MKLQEISKKYDLLEEDAHHVLEVVNSTRVETALEKENPSKYAKLAHVFTVAMSLLGPGKDYLENVVADLLEEEVDKILKVEPKEVYSILEDVEVETYEEYDEVIESLEEVFKIIHTVGEKSTIVETHYSYINALNHLDELLKK